MAIWTEVPQSRQMLGDFSVCTLESGHHAYYMTGPTEHTSNHAQQAPAVAGPDNQLNEVST